MKPTAVPECVEELPAGDVASRRPPPLAEGAPRGAPEKLPELKRHSGRILVPLDWSAGCYERVRWASALAERLGGTVSLLHVIESTPVVGGWRDVPMAVGEDEAAQQVRARLRRWLERRIPEGVRGQGVVRRGKLVREMVEAMRQMEVDLVVLGQTRRWGWARLAAPSRIRKIVREAPCPALVIPEGFGATHGSDNRDGVTMMGRRVLVPVDGSEHSRAAVEWGAAVAEPTEGSLVVFHVSGLYGKGPRSHEGEHEGFRAQTADALEQRLWAWAQRIVPWMKKVQALQETGMAGWDVLASVALREGCDLIVVSHHTVGMWSRLLGGCLAEELVAGAMCPVLCLPEGSAGQKRATAGQAGATGSKADALEMARDVLRNSATAAQTVQTH